MHPACGSKAERQRACLRPSADPPIPRERSRVHEALRIEAEGELWPGSIARYPGRLECRREYIQHGGAQCHGQDQAQSVKKQDRPFVAEAHEVRGVKFVTCLHCLTLDVRGYFRLNRYLFSSLSATHISCPSTNASDYQWLIGFQNFRMTYRVKKGNTFYRPGFEGSDSFSDAGCLDSGSGVAQPGFSSFTFMIQALCCSDATSKRLSQRSRPPLKR